MHPRYMHRKFIALIIATAVAVTTLSAAPARADHDKMVGVLAGIAAIAMIGAAVEKRRKEKNAAIVARSAPPQVPPRHQGTRPAHRHPRHEAPHQDRPRYGAVQANRFELPNQCERRIGDRGAPARLFGAGCLQNVYRYTASLPAICRFRYRDGQITRTGYAAKCLQQRGYRTARY